MEKAFKYHGLGNDFVVLDRRSSGQDIGPELARSLCDRRRGIGGDGVLVVLPSRSAAARMVVHNADGSVAEMCGNGIRCVVKHLADGMPDRPHELSIETGAGVLKCGIDYGPDGRVAEVAVEMGPARLIAEHLPSGRSGRPFVEQPLHSRPDLCGTAISMGNPHLVLLDVPPERAAELGPALEHEPGFCQRTNVEFCRLEQGRLEVAVWERGVGLTQACGTGACAAVAAAVHLARAPSAQWVPVRLPGGKLAVRVARDLSAVEMRGPAAFAFEALLP